LPRYLQSWTRPPCWFFPLNGKYAWGSVNAANNLIMCDSGKMKDMHRNYEAEV
jgi:hypothetical protein